MSYFRELLEIKEYGYYKYNEVDIYLGTVLFDKRYSANLVRNHLVHKMHQKSVSYVDGPVLYSADKWDTVRSIK